MDLDRELHDMLREHSNDVRPSWSILPATLRKARIQRAIVGLGTGAAVVALGFAGVLAFTAEGAPEIFDSPARQVIASESGPDESWELSVSRNEEEICARLEVLRSGEIDAEVDETCAPEELALDAKLAEIENIPLAWGVRVVRGLRDPH